MAKIKVTGGVKVSGQLRAKRFNTPPAWDTIAGSLGTPFENQAFTVTPGATDPDTFPDANITYSLVSGSLPSGLTLNSATSEISGTPAAVGSDTLSNFTLRAADGQIGANKPGKFDERDFSITVLDDVAPSFDQAADFSIGSVAELAAATLFQITATDPNTNPQTITFSEVGAVLTGDNLSLDANGNVTGTPPDNGGTRVVTFTVRASDGTLTTDQDYKLTITDSQDPIWVTAVGLLATVNESEAITTITLVATDDNAVSYSVTSGALPGGLTLNSSTGDITGTPSNVTEDTTSDFEVTATDTVELDFTARCFSIKVLNVIVNSLRFNDDDNAYTSRTPGATNRTTWTFSTWVKISSVASHTLFQAGVDDSNKTQVMFHSSSQSQLRIIHFDGASVTTRLQTTQLLRDFSAWYHIVAVWDTDNGTADDRHRLYINGLQVTDFNIRINPASGKTSDINAAVEHRLGSTTPGSNDLDGYLSETYFVDGTALEPTSFGAFDSNGDWQPKEYSGAFGTNGFHLDFAVAPGTGNGGGTDVSGNANHFTDNSLTASDQVLDSPTSNYAVLNPLQLPSNVTLSDGNLTATGSSTGWKNPHATFLMDKNAGGKYYFEVTSTATGTDEIWWGIIPEDETTLISNGTTNGHNTINRRGTASYRDSVVQDSGLTALGDGETGMCAIDLDNEKIWFGREGTWDAGGDPATNTGGITLFGSKDFYYIVVAVFESRDLSVDFGQLGYAETKPTGFDSINSANLPTPTIANPSDHFETLLWTGNGTGLTISGMNFAPNFVWIKQRTDVNSHSLNDTVRGTTTSLSSDTFANENNFNTITAFNSDGFTVGTSAQTNSNGSSYVGWCWNESTTPGFDIVSYTGTGAAHTESHSLGVVPDLMIVKGRDLASVKGWRVYHSSNTAAPETDFLNLNETSATSDNIANWNDTAPTSSVFTVGTDSGVNADTKNYIAYLWTEVEGFSKFGSYIGNASTDGPFIWCGFRPAYVMIKRTDIANDWLIHDAKRNVNNIVDLFLEANDSDVEITFDLIDILSNGYKVRTTTSAINASGGDYIFIAFAESPFKTARAR